jgi:hypothetical protein
MEKVEPSLPGVKRLYTFFLQPELEKLITDAGFTVIDCREYASNKRYKAGLSMPKLSCFARKYI